jgi:superfamily II DNA or RNA helicase
MGIKQQEVLNGNIMIQENSTKTLKQKEIINTWISQGAKSWISAATGFGKSYIAVLAIKECNNRGLERIVNVVVPTTKLKEDWTGYFTGKGKTKKWINGHIQIHNLKNVNVYVINTYVTAIQQCNLLIIDEGHRTANENSLTFKTVISRTKFNWIMALSATFSEEHKMFFRKYGMQEAGNVKLQECIDNGWVSKNRILCVPIHFNDEEKERYKKMKKIFDSHFATFKFDFKLAMSALTNEATRVMLAFEYGGLNSEEWTKERIMIAAVQWNRNMQLRKEMLYTLQSKLDAAVEIANTLKLNTILFGQTNDAADYIAEKLGDECVCYHSKLKSKEKKEAIKKLSDGRTKVKYISSVKALEEGFNVPKLEVGINYARTSKQLPQIQKNGRSNRFVEGKTSYFIELYVPSFEETDNKGKISKYSVQDEVWLKSSLKGTPGVLWLNDINQVFQIINQDKENARINSLQSMVN